MKTIKNYILFWDHINGIELLKKEVTDEVTNEWITAKAEELADENSIHPMNVSIELLEDV